MTSVNNKDANPNVPNNSSVSSPNVDAVLSQIQTTSESIKDLSSEITLLLNDAQELRASLADAKKRQAYFETAVNTKDSPESKLSDSEKASRRAAFTAELTALGDNLAKLLVKTTEMAKSLEKLQSKLNELQNVSLPAAQQADKNLNERQAENERKIQESQTQFQDSQTQLSQSENNLKSLSETEAKILKGLTSQEINKLKNKLTTDDQDNLLTQLQKLAQTVDAGDDYQNDMPPFHPSGSGVTSAASGAAGEVNEPLSNLVNRLTPSQRQELQALGSSLQKIGPTGSISLSSQQIVQRFTSELKLTNAVDVNALIQLILGEVYQENTEELRMYAEKTRFFNNVKKKIREEMNDMKDILAKTTNKTDSALIDANLIPPGGLFQKNIHSDATDPDDPTQPLIDKPQDAAHKITTYSELKTYIDKLDSQLNTVGDDAQMATLELQNMLQKQQQTLQQLSNISKMLFDTAMAIIRKIS